MNKTIKNYIFLHSLLLIQAFCGVFSKLASNHAFLSTNFIIMYGISLALLGIYAILWNQILKRFSLTTAFFNKAITVVWGMVFGKIIFGEAITFNMVVGTIIVIIGIVVVVSEHEH